MTAQNTEDTNLLRSHYYLFSEKYDNTATPLTINDNTVYLHKNYRGYGRNYFTHTNFCSLIRILGFKYFKFNIVNLSAMKKNYNQFDDCSYSLVVDDFNNDKITNILDINNEIVSDKYNIYANFENLLNINQSSIIFRNSWLYIDPIINFNNFDSPEYFDYKTNNFSIIHFFKYINYILNSNVSNILQAPIKSVFSNLSLDYNAFILLKDYKTFGKEILPSMYDYLVTYNIFEYIDNIHKIDKKYTAPTKYT
uniref:Uncharacterized protein n=1 Tax=Faxonius propinquus nudivirus TaxID=3139431 RepID=A0AAU8GE72_9VIRU